MKNKLIRSSVHIESPVDISMSSEKLVLFGSGSAARDWITRNPEKSVDFIVDNNPESWGKKLAHLTVQDPVIISDYSQSNFKIFVVSAYVQEIRQQLEQYGYKWGRDAVSGIGENELLIDYDISVEDFFRQLNKKGVAYIVTRHYDRLPDLAGGDIDLLVHDQDLDKLLDCGLTIGSFERRSGEALARKVDVYSVFGSVGYRYRNMALFPPRLGIELLKNRVKKDDLYCVPANSDAGWSYLYYICYLKGAAAGVPARRVTDASNYRNTYLQNSKWEQFDPQVYALRHNLTKSAAGIMGVPEAEVSLLGIHRHLKSGGYTAPLSTLRRHVGDLENIGISQDNMGEFIPWKPFYDRLSAESISVIVYFIKERANQLSVENHIIQFLEKSGLIIAAGIELSDVEGVMNECRGGNWYDDKGQWINGAPYKILLCVDESPERLTDSERRMALPFVEFRSYFVKERLRSSLFNHQPNVPNLNLVHTTDDLFETFEALSSLCLLDKKKLYNEIVKSPISYKLQPIVEYLGAK